MSTSPVSRDTVSTAVAALGKWMSNRSATSKPQLLLDDRDDFFILLLSLRRIPSKGRINPFFLPIPHSIFPLSDPSFTPSVFLIIDDRAPDSPPPSKFLDEAKEHNLPISEVIGISTLRSDYRPFESRRKLCGSHDLFLADKSILPQLPRLLGNTFFQKKKIPLPVNLSRVGWKDQIKRILNSTLFYLRSGTCSGIRVGRLSMEGEQIVDNVMAVIDEVVEKIPKKWENVRSLHLKAVDSVALPVYQALPEIGLKIEIGEREGSGVGEGLNGDEVVEEKSGKKKKKKGGVRYTDEVALVGDELIEEDDKEKEKNKKRKKRSKEATGGDSIVDEIEVETNKKKKKKGSTGAGEIKVGTKKEKCRTEGESTVDKVEVKLNNKKKNQENSESIVDKVEVKLNKKNEKQENSESIVDKVEVKLNKKKKKTQENSEVKQVESATIKKKKERVG